MTKKAQERWLKGVKIQNNFTGVHAPGPFLEAYEFDGPSSNDSIFQKIHDVLLEITYLCMLLSQKR